LRRKKDGADFVLQDVRMPDIDGIQILKSIRRPLPAAEPDCGHAAGIKLRLRHINNGFYTLSYPL